MAPTVSEGGSERSAMERFGSGGMALLPWTKQMLTVLWEHLRLLVQVIYYTFLSVFQMFRFELHVRITDESGEHIQHMGTGEPESFLFSSLFDGENGVMVGGSNPLSTFCADVGDPFTGKSTAEALLSSLRGDDLCCGLVEDFVSRSAGKEDSILLGHQSTWKMGFPGDWNIFVSSSDGSSSTDACHKRSEKISKPDLSKEKVFKQDTSEEERSSHWSSEEDQNLVEFESEESKALWESLSKSSDPYNPFFFSACISTKSDMGQSKSEGGEGTDSDLTVTKAGEVLLGPPKLNMWVCHSDSESSWSSWASSDGSSPDIDKEENERLWDFFSSPEDPYNPLCFTATSATVSQRPAPLPAPPPKSDTDSEDKESSFATSDDDEEELLWNSLSQKDDPYHPLNFQACLQSSLTTAQHENTTVFNTLHTENLSTETKKKPKAFRKSRSAESRPALTERNLKQHSHPDKTLVPWKRPEQSPPVEKRIKASSTQKKVQFSPLVQVHVMRTWPFARQASRKGHWEELARDRDRFRRRVLDTERAIGNCFTQSHREKMRAFVDGALKQMKGPDL
ncbi:protein phosphatase 1 regulatory subunit 15A [Nothobranchius furzeri]|uniref:Protein phosphatase 1 regulatory subunit 15A-like n=1 Tax=Nothobranchius furzeri TaxID=105023 RepID=A0A1A8UUU5_NOTFU|nr:protein phosphatase 1 regulatory subunit 15B [Nothobranchius furzeri]KAF7223944.1 protein phosphatase 1 regulatory subunit 15A-like [Nothobranchius furzeri]